MKKVEINVYNYDELDENIKGKLLEERKQLDFDDYCTYGLEEDMQDIANELLEKYFKGAKFKGVKYDLSYRQGSGAMIEFSINVKDINNKYKMLDDKEMNRIENSGYTDINVINYGNYSHTRSFDIDWQDYTFYIENFLETQEKMDKMIEKFENDIVDMNTELTKKGYDLVENFEVDSEEFLRDNEYLKDGTVYIEGVL